MQEMPLTLTWGDGDDSASWLPADAQSDGLLITKLAAAGYEPRDIPAPAHQLLELAGIEGVQVKCPGCTAEIPYVLVARQLDSGDEEWATKPCPICDYTAVVNVIPHAAVLVRRKVEILKEAMLQRPLTKGEQAKLKAAAKKYTRIMSRTK